MPLLLLLHVYLLNANSAPDPGATTRRETQKPA